MPFVYVIGPDDGPYKIGRTAVDVNARLVSLQTGNPAKLSILHTVEVEDASSVEAFAHTMLCDHRVSGEWFAADLVDVVKAVNEASGVVEPSSGSYNSFYDMPLVERVITRAMMLIEEMPPDEKLSDIIVMLGRARRKMTEYSDAR